MHWILRAVAAVAVSVALLFSTTAPASAESSAPPLAESIEDEAPFRIEITDRGHGYTVTVYYNGQVIFHQYVHKVV